MAEEKNNLVEGQFGTGEIEQIEDPRDIAFASVAPFDWELGFDIELLLGYRAQCKDVDEFFGPGGREAWGVDRYREIVEEVKSKKIPAFKIPLKNQGASSSCTGQGLSYYLEVLNFIETGEWVKISARDIYAYISLGKGRGAYLRDALRLACNRGIGTEDLVPCYHSEIVNERIFVTPYSEDEYLVKPEETEALVAIRTALQGKEYQGINQAITMDAMAWQMLMGLGTYFAVDGDNNGTWTSEYPQPPASRKWGHALFGGKAGLDKDGQPFISPVNSWGTVGVDGWQKLKANYYEAGAVRSPWTLIDKNNNWNMTKSNIKIIKDKNSPAVGIWLPALSPEALESYCLNFGIEVPKKADGSIDWDKWIEGEMILKN